MRKIEFGDKVHYSITGYAGTLLCIGHPHYAPDGSVVVLADEKNIGMPINIKWCSLLSKGHVDEAGNLRGRYIDKVSRDFLVPVGPADKADGFQPE